MNVVTIARTYLVLTASGTLPDRGGDLQNADRRSSRAPADLSLVVVRPREQQLAAALVSVQKCTIQNQGEPGRKAGRQPAAGQQHLSGFQRLTEGIKNVPRELGGLVQKKESLVRE